MCIILYLAYHTSFLILYSNLKIYLKTVESIIFELVFYVFISDSLCGGESELVFYYYNFWILLFIFFNEYIVSSDDDVSFCYMRIRFFCTI